MRRFTKAAVIVLLAVAGAFRANAQLPLTSLAAIHGLDNEQASHSLPVAFGGVVTYAADLDLFVQEGGVAIYIDNRSGTSVHAGDRVWVEGRTRASYRPEIVASRVTPRGRGRLPEPVEASFRRMVRGELDCMRARMRAQVMSADQVTSGMETSLYLHMRMEGGTWMRKWLRRMGCAWMSCPTPRWM